MTRTFEPNDLVQLPALDALAAQALGSAVLAAAADRTLPGPIADAVAELKAALETLQAAASDRLPINDPAARAADINLDAAWSSLHGLLRAVARLPNHANAGVATMLRGQLFPDGLRFTRLPFRLEWAESANRLHRIDERGFAPQIEQIGGGPALAQIREAHVVYGEALSITTLEPDPGVTIRDARTAVLKALRVLVVRVSANVLPQDPASAALARALLTPIQNWEHTAPAKPPTDHPAVTPAPAPTEGPLGAGAHDPRSPR